MDRGIREILEGLNKENDNKLSECDVYQKIEEGIGWDNLPPGWDRDSVMSFARSLTDRTQDDAEGFFTKCFERIKDEEGFDEESAKKFCASLKDEYLEDTEWRKGPDGDED